MVSAMMKRHRVGYLVMHGQWIWKHLVRETLRNDCSGEVTINLRPVVLELPNAATL